MDMILSLARKAFYFSVSILPLKLRRRAIYLRAYGRLPNLLEPARFSEKINWRIVNDRRNLMKITCDKKAMKDYVTGLGTAVEVPRTIWSGTDLDALLANLPSSKWILKPNHSSGAVIRGEGAIQDIDTLRRRTRGWLRNFNHKILGEWAYSCAEKSFLLEEMIGDGKEPLPDYKFYVFDGVVRLIHVDVDRFGSPARRMYTPSWEPLPYRNAVALADVQERPTDLAEMSALASEIGKAFDFIRVDLYRHDGKIWFGELTPYPAGGAKPYKPEDIDHLLGSFWKLPVSINAK